MPNIKLKGQTGEVLTFEDVERVYFDSADQDGEVVYYTHGTAVTKSVEPYFASGNDMNVPIADGELVTQLTIEKPDELNEDNIRSGATVAGVKGKFIGDTEEVTVGTTESGDTYELDFSGGNVVVEPTAPGKVISKATILKPGKLAAENIRKDVEIGGIVGEFMGDTEELTVDLEFPEYTPETDILVETRFATSYISEYGAYGISFGFTISRPLFPLALGDKCIVVWDESEYEVTVGDSSTIMPDTLYVGNGSGFGLPGNAEPFAIAWDSTGVTILSTVDTEWTEHTIRIYQSGSSPDQVIVPSENGKVLTKVTVAKPETLVPENVRSGIDVGGVVGSFLGDTEEKTVELNFANGTQTVEPSAAGKVLSAVNILKPDKLLPENIAKDINIAGIIGTFAGGGGVKLAYGKISGSATSKTVTHGLGVVPDLVLFQAANMPTSTYVNIAFGVSEALRAKIAIKNVRAVYSNWAVSSYSYGIENTNSSFPINSANAQTFTISGNGTNVPNGGLWLAIAELT